LGGLPMENIGIFYDHLVYFRPIGNMLWPFGIFCDHVEYFSPFWYFVPRKIWQPWMPSPRWSQLLILLVLTPAAWERLRGSILRNSILGLKICSSKMFSHHNRSN
jgi:hypothetical protein